MMLPSALGPWTLPCPVSLVHSQPISGMLALCEQWRMHVWAIQRESSRVLMMEESGYGMEIAIGLFAKFVDTRMQSFQSPSLPTKYSLAPRTSGHPTPINSIKVSQDGHWVVSGSDDGSVRILDGHGKPIVLPQWMPFRIRSVDLSRDGKLIAFSGAGGEVHTWCPDMTQPTVWPDSFIRKMHGREYCPIDDQGILADATLRFDGWLCGPMDRLMCWIPPAHQKGLLQGPIRVLGARETALDMRNFVHGTNWEQCAAK